MDSSRKFLTSGRIVETSRPCSVDVGRLSQKSRKGNGEEQLPRESIWTPYRIEKSYSIKPATWDGKVGVVIFGWCSVELSTGGYTS